MALDYLQEVADVQELRDEPRAQAHPNEPVFQFPQRQAALRKAVDAAPVALEKRAARQVAKLRAVPRMQRDE